MNPLIREGLAEEGNPSQTVEYSTQCTVREIFFWFLSDWKEYDTTIKFLSILMETEKDFSDCMQNLILSR